jgi:hypothetical protein
MLNEQLEYLQKQRELWQERQDEQAKRKEMDALLKRKKEEQEHEQELLNRAAEWVQAHWRGVVARRDAQK